MVQLSETMKVTNFLKIITDWSHFVNAVENSRYKHKILINNVFYYSLKMSKCHSKNISLKTEYK